MQVQLKHTSMIITLGNEFICIITIFESIVWLNIYGTRGDYKFIIMDYMLLYNIFVETLTIIMKVIV